MEHEYGVCEAIENFEGDSELKRVYKKLRAFSELLEELRAYGANHGIPELIDQIVQQSAYEDYLREDDPEKFEDRKRNIEELINRAAQFEQTGQDPSLIAFMEELALVAAIDDFEEKADAVSLMTLHSAKGLEFPAVFMTGMEDGVFPGYQSIDSDNEEDMEEERRLFYVGITRAQKELCMTYAKSRRIHGIEQLSRPSRFLMELPQEILTESRDGLRHVKKRQFVNTPKVDYTNRYVNSGKQTIGKPKELETFEVGDLVQHKKFGLGTILEVVSVNADYQVKVNFVNAGEKVLFVRLAGIQKVKG